MLLAAVLLYTQYSCILYRHIIIVTQSRESQFCIGLPEGH